MMDYSLTITEDEAVVLFEYFTRFDESGDLSFRHTAEYLAFQRLSVQIDRTTSAMFKENYAEIPRFSSLEDIGWIRRRSTARKRVRKRGH